jgi:hypothetical protein
MNSQMLLSFLVGVGLAAACGFRVFVPLLVMSAAAQAGHLSLASGFEWIGTKPALIAFAAATVLEVLGYFIPFVDHLLDIAAAPAAAVAGIVVMASSLVGMSPFLRWSLALVAGGGVASLVHFGTGAVRLASTATTGGLGNPAVASAELGGAAALSVLAITLPLAAAALLAFLLYLGWRAVGMGRSATRLRQRR